MRRGLRDEGFFIPLDYTDNALREIDRFFQSRAGRARMEAIPALAARLHY